MARSSEWSWSTRTPRVSSRQVRREFRWDQNTINAFTILVLATAGVMIGIFATFMNIQSAMGLGVPWLFPYGVSVGIITVVFVIIMAYLSTNNMLTPGTTIVLCFILFVLYMVSTIETGIQLFGAGKVSQNCQQFVDGAKVTGTSIDTLAWLQQSSICSDWYAVFAFSLIGTIMFFVMMFYALQIGTGQFD